MFVGIKDPGLRDSKPFECFIAGYVDNWVTSSHNPTVYVLLVVKQQIQKG